MFRNFKINQHFPKLQARKLTRSVCLDTVLLKDEELARYLEYGKKELLLALVTSTLT